MSTSTPQNNMYHFSNQFPIGCRVLLVEYDLSHLAVMENMLGNCGYNVTLCCRAKDALFLLRNDQNKFDLVITEIHMPEMDGFKLLEIIKQEKEYLPVIMISDNSTEEVVTKSVLNGACYFLEKPKHEDDIRLMWQHVVRERNKKIRESSPKELKQIQIVEDVQSHETILSNNVQENSPMDERDAKIPNQKIFLDNEVVGDHVIKERKPRIVWSSERCRKFINAVDQLGGCDKAKPKKILELMHGMGCTDLSRENIASHLQKYRINHQKKTSLKPKQMNLKSSYPFTDQHSTQSNLGGAQAIGRERFHPNNISRGVRSNLSQEGVINGKTEATLSNLVTNSSSFTPNNSTTMANNTLFENQNPSSLLNEKPSYHQMVYKDDDLEDFLHMWLPTDNYQHQYENIITPLRNNTTTNSLSRHGFSFQNNPPNAFIDTLQLDEANVEDQSRWMNIWYQD